MFVFYDGLRFIVDAFEIPLAPLHYSRSVQSNQNVSIHRMLLEQLQDPLAN